MPAEAAQLEMADLNDWFGNFNGESIGHEQGPADVLAEEFQPAEDVDVAPNGGERPLWNRQSTMFVMILATLAAQIVIERSTLIAIGDQPRALPMFTDFGFIAAIVGGF